MTHAQETPVVSAEDALNVLRHRLEQYRSAGAHADEIGELRTCITEIERLMPTPAPPMLDECINELAVIGCRMADLCGKYATVSGTVDRDDRHYMRKADERWHEVLHFLRRLMSEPDSGFESRPEWLAKPEDEPLWNEEYTRNVASDFVSGLWDRNETASASKESVVSLIQSVYESAFADAAEKAARLCEGRASVEARNMTARGEASKCASMISWLLLESRPCEFCDKGFVKVDFEHPQWLMCNACNGAGRVRRQ